MTTPAERTLRISVWWVLVAGWVVAVWLMYDSLSAEPLVDPELPTNLAPPTLRTFFAAALFSGLELALVLALVWPNRPELYATRLGGTALALVTWIVMTTAPELTQLDWIHRVWLTGMALALAAALVGLLLHRASRRFIRPRA